MPKIGMEAVRREALIGATIAEVGEAGSLDVTVGRIAARAGVSSALAHHYFGSKERLFIASMRAILADWGTTVVARLRGETRPERRLAAIVEASFDPKQCEPALLSAWLAFYLQAQTVPEARRLLAVYRARLRANLVHEFAQLMPRAEAEAAAHGLGALIDGLYIRHAPAEGAPSLAETRAIAHAHLQMLLARTPVLAA
ncbi:MAG: transcriptional regulator BetI [Pseudomonadota bacterium]